MPALWVAIFTASALILTLIWTVAGAVFDARQAKRLFPLAASAAIAGSLLGNLAAGPMAAWLGTESLILAEALLLLAAATVLSRTPMRLAPAGPPQPVGIVEPSPSCGLGSTSSQAPR